MRHRGIEAGEDTKTSRGRHGDCTSSHYAHFTYYDGDGFPTDEDRFSDSLKKEKPTIAFIGDSFTEGYYLPYRQTFVHLVGQKFPEKQVLNLGVSGFAPDQYLLSARRHLPRFNVTDIVVMFFPNNDLPDMLKDTYRGYAKPYFGDSLDKPTNLPLRKLSGVERKRAVFGTMARHLALYTAFQSIRNKTRGREEPPPSADSGGVVFREEDMRKALRLIQKIKIEFPASRFVVYYVPRYEEILDAETLKENLAMFERLAADLSLEAHTLVSVVRQAADPAEIFIVAEGHFSPLGSRLVADHIHEILTNP